MTRMIRTASLLLALALAALPGTPAAAWPLDGVGNFSFQPIARGVYVMHGPVAAPSPQNRGFMNNPAFVETAGGVVLIDPGSTREVGRKVLAEIRKVTQKPVLAVFNTHIHGDHWLANHAIREAWPRAVIHGHPKMIERAGGNDGAAWLEEINSLTKGLAADTRITIPDKPVRAKTELVIDGETFRIHRLGNAHTNTDIMIEHVGSKTLFLGDNLFLGRLGQFEESADIHGNIDTLKHALSLKMKHYVPGHGKSGGPEVVTPFLSYLEKLRDLVTKGYRAEKEDYTIRKEIEPQFADWKDWAGFGFNFGKHVNKMYLEVEAREF